MGDEDYLERKRNMRKRKISVALFALMLAATGTFHNNVNVSAATKTFTVVQPHQNETKITGKVKKGCKVKVKINNKTYRAKVYKNGKYMIKVPKLKVGKKYRLTAYQKNKVYARKSFYALVKKLKINPYSEHTHIFSGYTDANAYVILKCHDELFTTTSSASGYWKIDIGYFLENSDLEVKVYKRGKKIAHYQKTSQPKTEQHQHLYDTPIYKTIHHDEAGHFETITGSDSYVEESIKHDICKTCAKDLTQEYVNGIRNGTYKNVKIPQSDKNTSDKQSKEILSMYNDIQWKEDMPLYEDFLAYGGWEHTCLDHELTEQTEGVMIVLPGAIHREWIVDQKAYDQKIVIGYKCSCGAEYALKNE